MNEILATLIFYFIFWIVIYIFGKAFKTQEKGLIIKPLYLNYKTTKLNNLLIKASRKGKNIWLIIWNISVALAFGQMIFIIYNLGKNLHLLINKSSQASQVFLLLPGLTVSWNNIPYLFLSLVILLVTHEFAHGIAALIEGIPLKSAGLFILGFIPGGFVEVNEEILKKAETTSKLRVFSAGSSTNLAVGLLILLLMVNFGLTISPFYSSSSSGVLITELIPNGAAEKVGLKKWDVIIALNDTKINDVESLTNFMNNVKPYSTLKVTTKEKVFQLTTQPHKLNASKALIGIYPFNYYEPKFPFIPNYLPYYFFNFGSWSYTILISVALINMLPIQPLDGGKIIEALLDNFMVKRKKAIQATLSLISAGLLGLNLVFSSLIFGFIRI
ncbi:MAG: site-2 protease family protein [Candidatus Bathyarchaeia archaeon]